MTPTTLAGILPATLTPFDATGRFAQAPFEQLVVRLFDAGVDGLYVCGTTGEGLLMSVAERQAVAAAAVATAPRGRAVIVHVGAAAFEDVRALAGHAARVGATAISSLPPSGPGFGFAETRRFYADLAACSELPLVVYYFPQVYPGISTLAQIGELCALPGVAGVKFTDFDLATLSAAAAAEGRVVYNGRDEVLVAGLLMGAHGAIGSFYNVVPALALAIAGHARAGEWAAARALQDDLNRLIAVALRFPLFPALKQMLTWTGIPGGPCLSPRAGLLPADQDALRQALVTAGFEMLTRPERPSSGVAP